MSYRTEKLDAGAGVRGDGPCTGQRQRAALARGESRGTARRVALELGTALSRAIRCACGPFGGGVDGRGGH